MSNIRFHIVCPGEESRIITYAETIYQYTNDGINGSIEFNGYIYYNIGEETKYGKQLDKALLIIDDVNISILEVEFVKRELIKKTDEYSLVDDEDFGEMNVCFFPTDHQRVHFKVIREIKKDDPIPEEYKTYF
jgi:hypothetical protein